jgi:hypothetical protein
MAVLSDLTLPSDRAAGELAVQIAVVFAARRSVGPADQLAVGTLGGSYDDLFPARLMAA